MLLEDFYPIIDAELKEILEKNPSLKKHKNEKEYLNKGPAFLVWFLRFYGQTNSEYEKYITDGNDDYSCDIIFSNENSEGKTFFYVVQSKWINWKSPSKYPKIGEKEFATATSDFGTILGGEAESKNEAFNQKYVELKSHLEENGEAKFIFFTMAQDNDSKKISSTKKAFERDHAPNVSLEIISVERIRKDFIDQRIKKIRSSNPLEHSHDANAEGAKITLKIERCYKKPDFIEYQGREKASIFLLKPKTIHELFEKYQLGLFFNNIRNPIPESNINKQMEDTLLREPDAFWYFNNGITAITKEIGSVGRSAKKFEVTGLQIINGAQTVHTIYSAYEKADANQREQMDSEVRVTMRLIESSNEEFNLRITRYANSQNKMEDRAFFANKKIQKRLQEASFHTSYWYETRPGEFRDEALAEKNGISIVSNTEFALAYLAFHLQRPIDLIKNENKLFISRKEEENGLYEDIFNEKTTFEDMLTSYRIGQIIHVASRVARVKGNLTLNNKNDDSKRDFIGEVFKLPILNFFQFFTLALSKKILTDYLKSEFSSKKSPDINKYVSDALERKEKDKLTNILNVIRFSGKEIAQIMLKGTIITHFDYEKLKAKFQTHDLRATVNTMIVGVDYEIVINSIYEQGY